MSILSSLAQHQPDVISRYFNQAASQYDDAAVLQQEVARRVLERVQWAALDKQVKWICDVGCGTGYLSRLLHKQFKSAQVLSLDIAPNMLQQAQNQQANWFSRQHFCQANSASLPLADQSVDVLVSNLMLQWCPDPQAVLAEFARVLKPQGHLWFTSFGPETLFELKQSWASVDNLPHVNEFMDIHELGDICLATGLRNVVMNIERITLTHSDIYSVMHYLKKIGANHVSGRQQRGLYGKQHFEKLKQAYEVYRENGVLPATYEVVYGHALGVELQTMTAPREVHIPVNLVK